MHEILFWGGSFGVDQKRVSLMGNVSASVAGWGFVGFE
jgi:hypothetical protein